MTTSLDLRSSAARRDQMTRRRLDRIVPSIMAEEDIDCWILVSREYAEDPVAQTMLPATWMSSRRRTILVFIAGPDGVRRHAVTRYEVDGLFPSAWDPEADGDQWQALARLVGDARPERIAVSKSQNFAHGDGLTATEHADLLSALGPQLAERVVSGEALAVRWLQTRLPEERPVLEKACSTAHGILRRALSSEAITPGTTTTNDLEWWLRDEVQRHGTTVWFHPTASVQRRGADLRGSFASKPGDIVIEPGDLVHIDFGLIWDHLCTDQQQHGYVLGPGEGMPPQGLIAAMRNANQLQKILIGHFAEGRTGNEVLSATLDDARSSGLEAMVYTHPIGYHGHGAGPTIGLWDQQDGVAGPGDIALFGPSAWSIELLNRSYVPEWESSVAIMLEEEAWFEDGRVNWVDGRQKEIWTI